MSTNKIAVYDSTGHHAPTSESRLAVLEMVACGLEPEDIAYALSCSPYEVELHYKEELQRGTRLISAEVAREQLKNCRAGDPGSQQFWLKHRAGWSAPSKVELTGKNGNPIEIEDRRKVIDNIASLMSKALDPRKNDPVKQ